MPYAVMSRKWGEYVRYEAEASGAVYPGYLLELDSNGKVKAHATAGGVAEMAIAVEDALQGNDIADQYAVGDLVQYNIIRKGDAFWGKIANGEAIAIGDKVVSNGNGLFKEATADSSATVVEDAVLGIALTACDMSDSSAADPDGWCEIRAI